MDAQMEEKAITEGQETENPTKDTIGSLNNSALAEEENSRLVDKESSLEQEALQIPAEVGPSGDKEPVFTDKEAGPDGGIMDNEKEPLPSVEEPPPALISKGELTTIVEERQVVSPEQSSLATANEEPPEDLQPIAEIEKEIHPLEIDKEVGSEQEIVVTKEEDVAPTIEEGPSPAVSEKGQSSIVSEGEKLPEVPVAEPAQAGPPVVAEEKVTPAIEEGETLSVIPPPEPSKTTVTETPPTDVAGEQSRPSADEPPPLPIISEEPPPARVEEAQRTAEEEAIEPPAPEEVATPSEPIEEMPEEHLPTVEEKLPEEVPVAEFTPEVAEKEAPPPIATTPPEEPPPTEVTGKQPQTVAEEAQPGVGEVSLTPEGPLPAEEAPVTGKEEAVEPQAPQEVATPSEPIEEVPEETGPIWEIWRTDPAEHVLFAVAITLIAGKVVGEMARLLGVPTVVGKIIIGMILGNIYLLSGWDFFNFLRVMPFLKHLSDFGALTLLLTMGLQTDLRATLRVGLSSGLVTLGGLIAPAGLGFLVGYLLLPNAPFSTKLLISIILGATSVGIIFELLAELKAFHTLEGRIITGAVVLGDTIVLLAFGVASGIVIHGQIPVLGVIIMVGIVSLFVSAVVITSLRYGESLGNLVTGKVPEGLKMSIVAVLCLLLAFFAESIGIHTIIGAFGAGLLKRGHIPERVPAIYEGRD